MSNAWNFAFLQMLYYQKKLSHVIFPRVQTCIYPGGTRSWIPEEGNQKSLVRGGSARRSNPLPFYIQFLMEKVPLSYASHSQMIPLKN